MLSTLSFSFSFLFFFLLQRATIAPKPSQFTIVVTTSRTIRSLSTLGGSTWFNRFDIFIFHFILLAKHLILFISQRHFIGTIAVIAIQITILRTLFPLIHESVIFFKTTLFFFILCHHSLSFSISYIDKYSIETLGVKQIVFLQYRKVDAKYCSIRT